MNKQFKVLTLIAAISKRVSSVCPYCSLEISQTNDALAFTTGSQSWNGFIQFLPSQVFNLPAGYTVNSADGLIVNNQWPVAVPVPAAVWLFGSGLLGLIGVARRKDAYDKNSV